ncbi:MAG: Histidine-tRNA ligase [Candidatus Roizmanbacteria bacterium GW2011_GWA2_33_33]|uniref:Histidine--tRNA ligase n=2 Tax=Candidatus Roizmaniibacteriota TaxID=1752723 RepID=A0A0G0DA39_9BACT|nr:MAG: Histidine-tRNA ligase [Candidatus Roizmanbacteria bacterium GW2011_GWA2_33_33]KKP60250.1 MAG: Histidine-tRNA ligase [Candidatus Roizmanbacteria bacterium GW2011_GWC2_34_23]
MDKKITPQLLKGFRDFLPEEKRKRDYILKKIIEVFELFGFEPLETPTLEYASLLMGKYGKEADKLVYSFKDRGDREVALRYDQTVPSARVLSQYQNILSKYFRRYQIQNVFRADKPQKGRFREFTQCDIDIFGTTSPISDSEIIAATFFAFKNVGYPKIKILINDRQILFETLKSFTNSKINIFSIIQSIDKIDKDRPEKVQKELVDKGIESKEKARNAIDSLVNTKISSTLQKIIDFSVMLGVPKEVIEFKPVLARGLDYYTGMIFEVSLPGYNVGSCGGGGRYDKLIGQLSGNEIPAVGIAFGFDRMVEAAEYFGIISNKNQSNQVLVTIFNKDLLGNSLNIAGELRKNKITTEVYPAEDRIDKQLKYANKKNIRYVIIIGPEEVGKGIVVLKDMKTGEQAKLTIEDVIKLLSND